jgi:putative membrane protein
MLLRVLCVLLPMVMAAAGFRSQALADFWLENAAVAVVLLGLVLAHKRLPLSNFSYLLIFVFLCAHEYGASYRYVDAPIGEWMKPWFDSSRNHYDRLVHFLFGLLITLPVYEAAVLLVRVRGWLSYLLPVQFVMMGSAFYEIAEWAVAVNVDPALGVEFIGAQGDPWDSSKDMAMALVGTVTAVSILAIVKAFRQRATESHEEHLTRV